MKEELFKEIRGRLLERLEMAGERTDEEIRTLIDELVLDATRRSAWSVEEKAAIGQELFYSLQFSRFIITQCDCVHFTHLFMYLA